MGGAAYRITFMTVDTIGITHVDRHLRRPQALELLAISNKHRTQCSPSTQGFCNKGAQGAWTWNFVLLWYATAGVHAAGLCVNSQLLCDI